MNVGSVMGAGLQGIQRGMEGLQKNAKDIATISSDQGINILVTWRRQPWI